MGKSVKGGGKNKKRGFLFLVHEMKKLTGRYAMLSSPQCYLQNVEFDH